MPLQRFAFTSIGFFLLLFALLYEGMLFHVKDVTHETYSPSSVVKQGVTQDGIFFVTRATIAPNIPPRLKIANHSRTLRAFIAPNHGGITTLYIESAFPHEYFTIEGSYVLSREYPILQWSDGETIVFFAIRNDGQLILTHVNVTTLFTTVDTVANEKMIFSDYREPELM